MVGITTDTSQNWILDNPIELLRVDKSTLLSYRDMQLSLEFSQNLIYAHKND